MADAIKESASGGAAIDVFASSRCPGLAARSLDRLI